MKAPQAKTGKSKTAKSKPPVPTFSPHEWVPLKDALAHIKVTVGEFTLAVRRFYQDALDGRLETALVEILPDGTEKVTFPKRSDWRQWKVRVPKLNEESACVTLVGEIDIVSGHFFVRRANLGEHYPLAATPPPTTAHRSDDMQPPPRRPGPPPDTRRWWSICGEIAARCVDPQTSRVQVPKSESKLAEEVLGWLQENEQGEPSVREMREAVKYMCAALRRRMQG